jgi:ATP-dependent Clp protease ATP-binding subunit ClpA
MKQSALTSEARGFSRRDVDMVTETDVSDVVSNGLVFCYKITGSESARLLKWKTQFTNVIGQRHAVVSVSKAIRRARVGLRDESTNCKFYIRWTNWCWKNRINKSFI